MSIVQALGLTPSKPQGALPLANVFSLPTKPQHHPRISQAQEWPKILVELFAGAGIRKDGKLQNASFSVADVERAYKASGARMPRVPPDRFLVEI
ncbi:MAG: hypothetical protein ACREXU_01590, partial [Gammaproteobacteria bacterium]